MKESTIILGLLFVFGFTVGFVFAALFDFCLNNGKPPKGGGRNGIPD